MGKEACGDRLPNVFHEVLMLFEEARGHLFWYPLVSDCRVGKQILPLFLDCCQQTEKKRINIVLLGGGGGKGGRVYLFFVPSHQQGTTMRVIPFCAARDFFNLSLS